VTNIHIIKYEEAHIYTLPASALYTRLHPRTRVLRCLLGGGALASDVYKCVCVHAETLYGGARGFSYLLNQLVTDGRCRRERKRERKRDAAFEFYDGINISRFHFAGCRRINFSAAPRQFLIAARGVKSPSRCAMAHFSRFYDQSECSCMRLLWALSHTFQSAEVRYVRSMHL